MSITLEDFLTSLTTQNIKVLVKDFDLNVICKTYASSISSLDAELKARTINRWDIITHNSMIIFLDGEPTPDIPVESVTLSETELLVQAGQSFRITATVLPEDATHPELTWLSSDDTVVTVEDGVITGLKSGEAFIYATADDVASNQCTVTVEGEIPIVPVESVILQETTISLNTGGTFTLVATVLPENATDKSVTWESSAPAIVSVEDGVVTGIVPGSSTITVTTVDGGFTAECNVTVSEEVIPIENIVISESSLQFEIGDEPVVLSAIITPSDATETITWASSDENVVTVSQGGLVTVVGVGTANITVSGGDVVSEPCVVIVSEQIIQVESVVLSESTLNLELGGESVILTAEVLPIDATDKTVTWASDNESVVTVDDGIVTILGVGQANITASAGDVVSEPCVVTVIEQQVIHVESVTLNESTLNLEVGGEPVTLTATILPENATDKTLSWISSDESVVSVEDGIITIIGEGNASITASADNVISQPCEVTVIQP